jgi:protein-S-isoprenylcysteine O-methyltransferase Ste14
MAAVLVVVGLHCQILQEEQFLGVQYGQAYQDYCASVPRYWRIGQETRRVRAGMEKREL